MDKIKIKNLVVFAKHGVFKEEQVLGQKFRVSATLYLDTRRAGKIDDINSSVHYGKVCEYIEKFMTTHTYKLLETVAERLAEGILTNFKLVENIELEIEKPWAPIGISVDSVSVAVERGWHTVFIGIGSNVGDRAGHIDKTMERLRMRPDCRVLKESMLLETKPYGNRVQDDFLNGCFSMRTWLSPEELLLSLHILEDQEGREHGDVKFGPRTMDLDILLYDDLVYESDTLVIPHTDMENRSYVLESLAEIAPNKRHPVYGMTIQQLYDSLPKEEE